MSSNIEYYKNKLKRLIIELHHRNNKISHTEHIIKHRDPNRPLLTLRVENNYQDTEDSTEENEDIVLFEDFSGFSRSTGSGTGAGSAPSNINGISRVSSFEKRHSCSLTRAVSPIITTAETDQDKRRIEMEEHKKRLEDSLQNNINYIEQKPPPPRRRFWFFGKRYPHSKYTKQKDSKEPIKLIDIDGEEEAPTQNIELILHSTEQENGDAREEAANNIDDSHDQFNYQINEKASSYSRRKHNVSLISLAKAPSRDNCNCMACLKKQQCCTEPWRVIMNDISLHAALLSTGSKPQMQYDSFNNLVADFTSSKHQEVASYNRRLFSNNSTISELVSLDPGLPNDRQTILNDENRVLESDLLEFSKPSTRRQISVNQTKSRPLTKESKQTSRAQSQKSVLSRLFESERTELNQPSSVLYDGFFQNYACSDDGDKDEPEGKTSEEAEYDTVETRPLVLTNRGLTQLF